MISIKKEMKMASEGKLGQYHNRMSNTKKRNKKCIRKMETKKTKTDNTGKAKTIVFQTLRSISVALIHNGNLLQDLQ